MLKNKLLSTVFVGGVLAASTAAIAADQHKVWLGASVTQDSYYSYIGAVTAVDSDLESDAFLARIALGYGEYDYDTVAVAGGEVEGDSTAGEVMVGFQKYLDETKDIRFTWYFGVNWEEHDISPVDANNTVQGSEEGFKTILELQSQITDEIRFNGDLNWSTAFDTHYASARVGYNFGDFTVGPEVVSLGNDEFNQTRLGLFVGDIAVGDATIGLNTGYAWDSSSDTATQDNSDSVYGGIYVGFQF